MRWGFDKTLQVLFVSNDGAKSIYTVRLDMRFRRRNGDRVLVVGIFQSPTAGRAVLKNLRWARIRRAAAIHAAANGRLRVKENGVSMIDAVAGGFAGLLALGAFVLWQRGMLLDYSPRDLAQLLAAFALGGALAGWILVRLLPEHVGESEPGAVHKHDPAR